MSAYSSVNGWLIVIFNERYEGCSIMKLFNVDEDDVLTDMELMSFFRRFYVEQRIIKGVSGSKVFAVKLRKIGKEYTSVEWNIIKRVYMRELQVEKNKKLRAICAARKVADKEARGIELAWEEVSLVGLDVVDREKKIEAIQRRWIALVKNGLV